MIFSTQISELAHKFCTSLRSRATPRQTCGSAQTTRCEFGFKKWNQEKLIDHLPTWEWCRQLERASVRCSYDVRSFFLHSFFFWRWTSLQFFYLGSRSGAGYIRTSMRPRPGQKIRYAVTGLVVIICWIYNLKAGVRRIIINNNCSGTVCPRSHRKGTNAESIWWPTASSSISS